ncbi:unnamed protein product, partial [Laminaria digitata]
PALRWKLRTHFNFAVGRSTLRALPVVIHLLSDDVDWFSEDSSLFDELKRLLRDRVISTFADGDKDPEAPKSRKRARKEELCVQGDRLQFTYRYRKTSPRYTVLQYADDVEIEPSAGDSSSKSTASSAGAAGSKGSASERPAFHHLPLSESTLLVWVYRFDIDDPYHPVPNAAALQFAPRAKSSTEEALDFDAVGRSSSSGAGAAGVQAGAGRNERLLSWLWGTDEGGGSGGGGDGRVRQHFVGSAAWQDESEPARERRDRGRDEEDDDIQTAIAMSLAAGGGGAAGG